MANDGFAFYDGIPLLDRFEDAGNPNLHVPLPGDWLVGVADIEDSTRAIGEGRYKAVNLVGAAVISGVMNALGTRSFPFIFAGDGASVAVPASAGATVAEALAQVRRYAFESLGLTLRVGLVSVDVIRAAGHDVRVARFGASPDVAFALFSGHGLAWAERELKAGRLSLPEAAEGAWPNLEGLSCRWEPIRARNGRILSILARPAPGTDDAAFAGLVGRISAVVDGAPDRGNPVSAENMHFHFPPAGLAMEAGGRRGRIVPVWRYLKLLAVAAFGAVIFYLRRPVGRFDPDHYLAVSVRNSDFRKFDDGLRMTVDADAQVEARIRAVLDEAAAAGITHYGIHAQDSALMTCLVPSLMRDDHMHFIDGASGGYAQAAVMLKAQAAGVSQAA